MPVPTSVDKNIWVAAGDGDFARVRVSSLFNSSCDTHQTERIIVGVS
jgi:hypothetical protein